jgi:hypothetical protein
MTKQEYFAPGNIVPSYVGFDKVIAFNYGEQYLGGWEATVQACHEDGSPDPKDTRIRKHCTMPNKKELIKVIGHL